MAAADLTEILCSAERPPKIKATVIFFRLADAMAWLAPEAILVKHRGFVHAGRNRPLGGCVGRATAWKRAAKRFPGSARLERSFQLSAGRELDALFGRDGDRFAGFGIPAFSLVAGLFVAAPDT